MNFISRKIRSKIAKFEVNFSRLPRMYKRWLEILPNRWVLYNIYLLRISISIKCVNHFTPQILLFRLTNIKSPTLRIIENINAA